jgi:hypothetical protein
MNGVQTYICEKIDKGVGHQADERAGHQKKASSIPYEGMSSQLEFVEVNPWLLTGKKLRS